MKALTTTTIFILSLPVLIANAQANEIWTASSGTREESYFPNYNLFDYPMVDVTFDSNLTFRVFNPHPGFKCIPDDNYIMNFDKQQIKAVKTCTEYTLSIRPSSEAGKSFIKNKLLEKSYDSPAFIELYGEEFAVECFITLGWQSSSGDSYELKQKRKKCVNATTVFIEKFEFSVSEYFRETERARARYEEKVEAERLKKEVSNSLNATDVPAL